MVPIHDTDLAQERWSKAEWENYELWEKIEVRIRRKRRIWILVAWIIFLFLCSIPILEDRIPKWHGLKMVRVLSQEINEVKRDASIEHAAYRVHFTGDGTLNYVVERASSCSDLQGTFVRKGSLDDEGHTAGFVLMEAGDGLILNIPGLVDTFCYDYLAGNASLLKGESTIAFGIVPVKDLSEKRLDRISLIIITGVSAEITFE